MRRAAAALGLCAAVLAGLAAAAVAVADDELWRVEPAASTITFTLGATLHRVEGTAAVERGEVRFDLEGGTAAGEIAVAAASLATGNEKRDRDMHRKVLESERYPAIVFTVESLAPLADAAPGAAAEVAGRLAIHGSEQPLAVPVELEWDEQMLTVSGAFSVPYVAWGMADPSKLFLRVDKSVDVTFTLVGSLGPADG